MQIILILIILFFFHDSIINASNCTRLKFNRSNLYSHFESLQYKFESQNLLLHQLDRFIAIKFPRSTQFVRLIGESQIALTPSPAI